MTNQINGIGIPSWENRGSPWQLQVKQKERNARQLAKYIGQGCDEGCGLSQPEHLRCADWYTTNDNVLLSYRARATNTQLGEDETSEFISLDVYGEDGADVPPEILFPPKDQVILKGSYTELHCIANAR